MLTLSALANFSTTVMDTFLSPFSILVIYVLSKSAENASDSCEKPFSNLRRFKFLPNFFLISMLQNYDYDDICTTDYCQHYLLFFNYILLYQNTILPAKKHPYFIKQRCFSINQKNYLFILI